MKYLMIVLVAVADDTRGLLENVNWSPDEEVRSQMRWWAAVIALPRREKQSLRGVHARGVGSVRTVVVDVIVDSRIAGQSQCQVAGDDIVIAAAVDDKNTPGMRGMSLASLCAMVRLRHSLHQSRLLYSKYDAS